MGFPTSCTTRRLDGRSGRAGEVPTGCISRARRDCALRLPAAVLSGPTDKRRIALVGDSYVFAQHVRFEDSLGHLLEGALGANVQVLNFGVIGYGVDQAYLRFKKDVLAWKPEIVVLGFPEHNLFRTMTVYPFINWPDWDARFSKPRLILDQGALRSLNVPTIPPNKMFAMRSVSDLPFLEYDQGYNSGDWEHSALDLFYAKRWLLRLFPRWSKIPPHLGQEERLRLNSAILTEFIRSAKDNGIVPLIVFFPAPWDIERRSSGHESSAQRALQTLSVPVLDTMPCLIEAGSIKDMYLHRDAHYSARGNAAVTKCVRAALEPVLAEQRTQKPMTDPVAASPR